MLTAAALAAAALGCSPQPGLGSVAYVRGDALHVVELASCRDRVLVARGAAGPVRFVDGGRAVAYGSRWIVSVAGGRPRRTASAPPVLRSPDGRRIAGIRARRRPGGHFGTQTIWVRDVGTPRERAIHVVRESYVRAPTGMPGPLGLVGWSPDARWLLFFVDPQGSASIAADGLELQILPAVGGRPRTVAGMLMYPDYLTWCGHRLVLTAGGDRIATTNKRLAIASAPRWQARTLVRAGGRAWGSVACAPAGRSLVVQSQPASNDANFFHTHWALWRVGLDGSLHQLTTPSRASADESPRWSRDGRSLLFVRSRRGIGQLYLWTARGVVGPLASFGYGLGYYGHHDWWYAADWSR